MHCITPVRKSTRNLPVALFLTCALSLALILYAAPTRAHAATPFAMGLQQDGLTTTGNRDSVSGHVSDMRAAGASVLRITIRWNEVAKHCGKVPLAELRSSTQDCYQWQSADEAVKAANARGMTVIASVTGTPQWLFPGISPKISRYWTGKSGADSTRHAQYFAAFMRAAGERFAPNSTAGTGTITHWTIWNEPNNSKFWKPFTRDAPERYARMYRLSATELRGTNSRALIAAGPTAPKPEGMAPLPYIKRVQLAIKKRNAGHLISAWAHNPYSGGPRIAPYRRVLSGGRIGMGNLSDLVRVLDSSPVTRNKKIWATEFAYQTRPEDRTGITYGQQAAWLADGFRIMSNHRRVSIAIWYVFQDPAAKSDWQSGLKVKSGANKPSYAMFQRPISVTANRVRRGSAIRLWGKTNLGLVRSATRLEYSYNGRTWRKVPGQRTNNTVRTGAFRITKKTFFRVRDEKGAGPRVKVVTG